jgi:hypothetical protein
MRVATAIDIEKAPQTLVDNHAVDKKRVFVDCPAAQPTKNAASLCARALAKR